MNRTGQYARHARLATAGITALLLAAGLSPAADAAEQDTYVRDVIVDKDGSRHVRYDRTYRELPVLGGDFVVHLTPDGTYRGADRATKSAISLPGITPEVPAPEAAGVAADALRAAHPGDTLTQVTAEPQLVVDALHGAPRLAWRTEAAALDPLGNPVARTVLTDARTGARIDAWDTLEAVTGDGRSLYSGTVALETTPSGSAYQLKDPTRGDTYTRDASGTSPLTDDDNHWGTGTTDDPSTAAVDAQYGSATTWDYFKDVHGRNGIADDGKGSYNRVHYGNKLANAYWNDACFCMTYGDGDGTNFGPMTGLDVTAHEMTHGVTSRTAGLVYTGESGGLNEATSDILGTLVEFYAANPQDPGDYLIGEKIVRPGLKQDALRYMDRPSRDGGSADYWSGSLAKLSVHYSSGVANHFAYLLAEGSGARTVNGVAYDSPTSDGSTITGIGRDRLGAIWYRALTVYMTSTTNYAGARAATLNAARDLYGAGGTEYATVAAAWSAVNVN
ncbi:M4 family metallopeptidase [Streptomyces acidiscabies]|uniref:Neutral metalloproteinase n=3 Tax=Streptomyces acidiscabies TaxID=42234 RepID=A0AAP6BJV2_9ACTN|nr:M4 family metallopeptidase [Streptomyces acidiscabies]MBP5941199.1 M4 family metallopeptidase [Streptomyces sp. LBUM 1476]MBZ3912526.1 M4 family metallopeptidase [Streptomyces acidiscabies]MDX2966038.1 M4 family metallopeptidase [Streptomyces acidiscabies]MDX3025500.1 M4 family metallopeptidase [Streptomyces acidiscabies]MDX3796077.1 M4 family metallopeptidase [Streptomyces acidiscabies]